MTRRRAPGEGSVRKRKDGRWEAALTIGHTDRGNPRRIFAYGRTRGEVIDKLDRKRAEAISSGVILPDTLSVEVLVERWLEDKARRCRPSTLENYRLMLEAHVVPVIGRERIQRITPLQIHNLLERLLKDGASRSLTRYVWNLVRGMFAQAVRWHVIAHNPADHVTPPARQRTERTVWTPDEVRTFLAAARDSRYLAAFYLALTCGLRRGEVLGLRISDYDQARGTINLRRALIVVDNRPQEGPPKSEAGRRTLYLPPDTREHLDHRLRILAGERELAQLAGLWEGGDNPYVFCSTTGGPTHPRNFLRAFKWVVARAGVRMIRFHDLRHLYGSLALARVPLPALTARLGHTDSSLTLDIYTHELEGDSEAAAIPLEDLLTRKETVN